MRRELPNLPLIQERFFYKVYEDLKEAGVKYPEFEVLGVFNQVWGSTALGFGGIGGQAITAAYTTVIQSIDLGYVGVFFGEVLAYIIKKPNEKFNEDLLNRQMEAKAYKDKYETE